MVSSQDTNTKKRAFNEDKGAGTADDSIDSFGFDVSVEQTQPNTVSRKPGVVDEDLNDLEMESSPEIADIDAEVEDNDDDDGEEEEEEEEEEITEQDAIGELSDDVQIVDDNGNIIDVVGNTDSDYANQNQTNNLASTADSAHGKQRNGRQKTYPVATDFDALASTLMKPIEDYPVEDSAHYVWEIKDWASLSKQDKVRSPTFKCGKFEWNILLFPRGNGQQTFISIYIEPHPPKDEATGKPLDENWYVCAQFGLDLWNPDHPDAHFPNQSSHRFSKNDTDWGFSSLIELETLKSIGNIRVQPSDFPILEKNQLNITAFVRVIDDSSTGTLWNSLTNYDSKTNAGYVGLTNQGATCYLNSLIQSYFTTKVFRKLVYQIPTNLKKNAAVAYALQRIFYQLSKSNDPVTTSDLTKSFGWDSSDAFTQHDVQELNRILMDKLETAMKGTEIENGLNDIFVGKMKSYIKCVNVPYESSRVEDFWDIQLNVKGCQNLEQSFKNYIEIEMLDGENKYQAGDEYGYQDAKKGVVFESFPQVLHLQLKRFEYDFMVDDLVKIDDFYEFPDKIDLKPYLDEDLPADVRNQNWNYKLHGVLVHQGTISNGHYYAMIKPNADDNVWLRFDDDKVWKVSKTQVFKENFGAPELTREQLATMSRLEQQEYLIRRVTSAYMLVYYRESELETILPSDEEAINAVISPDIAKQIQNEWEERLELEKERQEALYYITAEVITISTIQSHTGFDLALDEKSEIYYDESLAGTESDTKPFKIRKDSSFSDLVDQIGESLGYQDTSLFRLGIVCHRNNHTNRLDEFVDDKANDLTVISFYNKFFNRKHDHMVFYVEELNKDINNLIKLVDVEKRIDPADFKFDETFAKINSVGHEVTEDMKFPDKHSNDITIFVKYFDPVSQEVRSLSHITVTTSDPVKSIIEPVKALLGFKEDINLELYEELTPHKCDKLEVDRVFEQLELSTGDVIVAQVSNASELAGEKRFKNVKDYYRFYASRVHVRVKPFNANESDEDSDYVDEEGEEESENAELNSNKERKDLNGQYNDETTIKEIEEVKKLSRSFDLWISTTYSYQDLAEAIAAVIKCDPEYLRLFVIGNQGTRYPLKTSHFLHQIFPRNVSVNQLYDIEYEVLNIKTKEYENLKSFKVFWLSNLLQYQEFELLVPKRGTLQDLVNKLLHKVEVSEKDLKHLLCWSGSNHKFTEILRLDTPVSQVNQEEEIYCGLFPAEVEALCAHDIIKRSTGGSVDPEDIEDEVLRDEFIKVRENAKNINIIPAFHFHKQSTNHHGIPFFVILFPNELWSDTKERLRRKLGLGKQAFDKIKFALADANDKGSYIDETDPQLVLFDKVGTLRFNLALDHIDRSPKRQNLYEKGISIR
ncbi:UBP15 [Candida theae]|uniref:ubiquitinyl hydrolase 1 n=1 Tax=Candida theae TaxID=1198502 RepID=A0AAD5FXK4_9ASCO|nr:UBP15 [Candida theae]KAI5953778.1 UBP15 [Candida theae]